MVSQEIFKYKGEVFKFHQCLHQEEAKKEKLPAGLYFYWTLGDKKITNPYDAVQIYLKATEEEQSALQKLITPQNLTKHYHKLHAKQMETVKNSMRQTKAAYENIYAQSGISKQAIKAVQDTMDKQLDYFDQIGFPNLDGLFRPTRKQAEAMAGSKANLDKVMPEEVQRKVFDE